MLVPMRARTKFVILMHPHESRHIKNGTGRFAALSFEDAEVLVGLDWERDPRLRALLDDPRYKPVLLYPGRNARNLSEGGLAEADLGGKRLLVFVLDATWKLARAMFNQNPVLQRLDRIMFTPSFRSRFVIKRQPADFCLSTLEAVHELMVSLESSGLDRYERPEQLLGVFQAMQEFQLQCMRDESRNRYRPRSATRGERLPAAEGRVRKGIVGGGMGASFPKVEASANGAKRGQEDSSHPAAGSDSAQA